ncbi:MAG: N-acetyltransferase [Planctomycetota bacterium]
MSPLSIQPVRTRGERRAWLELPWRVNAGDPCWAPPLRKQQRELAGFGSHPVFQSADIQQWLATRGGEAVGRIAAIENRAHNEWHSDRVGFFGFFECRNDPEAAGALLTAAEDWLSDRDLQSCRGPMSPTINYELGTLVDGFDTPPYMLLTHNPTYYRSLIEGAGYEKSHDLYAYRADTSHLGNMERDEKMAALDAMVRDRFGVTARGMDGSRFRQEVEMFLDIYNRALTKTWGYVPMSAAEVHAMAGELRHLIVPELARVAEVEGKPVGVVFGLLDFNPRIKAIDGRLFPFGWARLLWNKRSIHRIRLVSTNVLPEYQSWGVGITVARDLLKPALEHGVTDCEFSWILESNHLSRKTVEKGGAERYKTWRIFEKAL